MTPMMEKFHQKRLEENSTVFSYSEFHERVQITHHGSNFLLYTNTCFYCSTCGITKKHCKCCEGE